MSHLFIRLCSIAHRGLVVLGALAASALSQGASAVHAAEPVRWPQSGSDLKPDPALVFGALGNGMRYVLLRNMSPPGRMALRFRLEVGARDELAEQAGYAHFLEHMAFRGSAHFADGEIMQRLAGLGLRAGSDVNANTSADTTVFRFDLTDNHADSIALALGMFRDVADGLDIGARAVDSERKVVLSEARLTDTPAWRLDQRKSEFALATLGVAEHAAIGTPQTIGAATADQLRTFYERFYRPERAILIVVGDADPQQLAVAIEGAFASWHGRGEVPAPRSRSPRTLNAPDVHVEFDPRLGNHADLAWVSSVDGLPDSEARERNDLILAVGISIVNRRYDAWAEGASPPFLKARIARYAWAAGTYLTNVTADSATGTWQGALIAAEAVRRGVLTAGVSQSEVDAETTRIIARYQDDADASGRRPSASLADALLADLDHGRVTQDPGQHLRRVLEVLKPLQAKTVDDALRAEFQGRTPAAWLTTTVPVPGGDAELRRAVREAEASSPRIVQAPTLPAWPYTRFGSPGTVTSRRTDDSIAATMIEFGNGVRLNLKKTAFAQDQVEVRVSFGHGYGDLSPDGRPVAWAIDSAFIRGGLRAIDYDTMQAVLAGKRYGVGFGMQETAFRFFGATRAQDLDTQLQVLAAYCTAPAFREVFFEQSRAAYIELTAGWRSAPYRELMSSLSSLLRSDDRRWALPSAEDLRSARLADFRELLIAELERAPIEITIVGDIDLDEAIRKVAATFGALKLRSPEKLAYAADGPFPQASATPRVIFDQAREDQGAAAIAWPTVEMLSDGRRFYALTLLADIMNTRLFERLRPASGTSYVSHVASRQSEDGPRSSSALIAQADVSPDGSQRFFDEVLKLAAELRSTPVSQQEFDRAQKPRMARLRTATRTNAFWAHWLDLSQRDPRRLDFAKHALRYLESVTPQDVQTAAQTYLREDASWRVVIRSDPRSARGSD